MISEQQSKASSLISDKLKDQNLPYSALDKYMALDSEPFSEGSNALCKAILSLINAESKGRRKLSIERQRAVGALLADLMAIAVHGLDRYGYREVGLATFTGMYVGYKPFKAVVEGMQRLALLTVITGDKGGPTAKKLSRNATRFRGTLALFELGLDHGVTPAAWADHFHKIPRQSRVAHPILLRSSSTTKRSEDNHFREYKLPGIRMKVDKENPDVIRMSEQVHDINTFTAGQHLDLGEHEHRFFQRIFGQGDTIGFDYTKGGRLYSPGKMSYQNMNKQKRPFIRFNGWPTVEVDIGSSFLTIYRQLLGWSFDPHRDPYEGIGELPRDVAKAWVVMTFGYDRHHTRWPDGAKRKYRRDYEEHGKPEGGTGDLQMDHPIGQTRKTMLTALPELLDWPTSTIRWGDLQFIESNSIVEAVHTLNMQHGVTALPVHDSIRVPVSEQALAASVLSDALLKHVGVRPAIKFK